MVGHKVIDVIGKRLFEESIKKNIDRCLKGESVRYELPVDHPTKGKRFFRVSYYPIIIMSGKKIERVVAVLSDVTERKETEKVKRESENLQVVLETAGAVCHELNQPLQVISGLSQLMIMNQGNNDYQIDKVKRIKEQVDRMGLINQKLMMITRYETKEYLKGKIIDIERSAEKLG